MSLNAQNEILQITAQKVLRGIASDTAESGYYSIMADESTYANNIEQLVIYIVGTRDDSMQGIYWSNASRSNKCNTIVACFKDVLLHMTGTKNEVAAQIKKLNEKYLHTHCYCHSLNLAVRNSVNKKFHC